MMSTLACMPVVTQLTAISTAHVQANNATPRDRDAHASAAMKLQIA